MDIGTRLTSAPDQARPFFPSPALSPPEDGRYHYIDLLKGLPVTVDNGEGKTLDSCLDLICT